MAILICRRLQIRCNTSKQQFYASSTLAVELVQVSFRRRGRLCVAQEPPRLDEVSQVI